MKKLAMALAAASMTMTGTVAMTSAPAAAKHRKHYNRQYHSQNGVRYWRGDDGRYRCKRSDGTLGTVVGAVGGALVGRTIDTRGDRTTGTVLGAAAGALLGHEVEKGRKISCR